MEINHFISISLNSVKMSGGTCGKQTFPHIVTKNIVTRISWWDSRKKKIEKIEIFSFKIDGRLKTIWAKKINQVNKILKFNKFLHKQHFFGARHHSTFEVNQPEPCVYFSPDFDRI